MIDSLQNRFTGFSLTGFALAITCAILATLNWPGGSFAPYLVIFAIFLLIGSVIVEVVGFYKSRHFSAEEARDVYEGVMRLINELRSVAPALHKTYDGLPDNPERYLMDVRYRELMREFHRLTARCYDYKLYIRLRNAFESEKLRAKYRLNSILPDEAEIAEKNVRSYISAKFRNAGVLENDQDSGN